MTLVERVPGTETALLGRKIRVFHAVFSRPRPPTLYGGTIEKGRNLKMIRFYNVTMTKWSVGLVMEYREPAVQGKVIIKVSDSTTAGDYKLFVVDASDAQHEANLTLSGVAELSEAEAVKLATVYQPERIITQFDPLTRKEEKLTVPACDLEKFYKRQE
jgi:hypothetical protein